MRNKPKNNCRKRVMLSIKICSLLKILMVLLPIIPSSAFSQIEVETIKQNTSKIYEMPEPYDSARDVYEVEPETMVGVEVYLPKYNENIRAFCNKVFNISFLPKYSYSSQNKIVTSSVYHPIIDSSKYDIDGGDIEVYSDPLSIFGKYYTVFGIENEEKLRAADEGLPLHFATNDYNIDSRGYSKGYSYKVVLVEKESKDTIFIDKEIFQNCISVPYYRSIRAAHDDENYIAFVEDEDVYVKDVSSIEVDEYGDKRFKKMKVGNLSRWKLNYKLVNLSTVDDHSYTPGDTSIPRFGDIGMVAFFSNDSGNIFCERNPNSVNSWKRMALPSSLHMKSLQQYEQEQQALKIERIKSSVQKYQQEKLDKEKREALLTVEADDRTKRMKHLTDRFGAYNSSLIMAHKIKLGFTKEMCLVAWGQPFTSSKITNSNGTFETLFYSWAKKVMLKNDSIFQIEE